MAGQPKRDAREHYEIRVNGPLDRRWSRWFENLSITALPGGETLLSGPVADQAALHGILSRIGDLGLSLLLVRRIAATGGEDGEDSGGQQHSTSAISRNE
jgi:hypothetical protein